MCVLCAARSSLTTSHLFIFFANASQNSATPKKIVSHQTRKRNSQITIAATIAEAAAAAAPTTATAEINSVCINKISPES